MLATCIALTNSILAFMLLANAKVDPRKRVFILAAACSSSNLVDPTYFTERMLRLVQYESIKTVLPQ